MRSLRRNRVTKTPRPVLPARRASCPGVLPLPADDGPRFTRFLGSPHRGNMPVITIRILVAGTPSANTGALLTRLAKRGWGARTVATIQQARQQLEGFAFDVTLASETLPDGLGYELAADVVRRGATLFVGVALSESVLWLPVIERGTRVLGTRGIHPQALLQEMESLLRARDREQGHRMAARAAAVRAFGASIRSRAWRRAPGYRHRPRQPLAGSDA